MKKMFVMAALAVALVNPVFAAETVSKVHYKSPKTPMKVYSPKYYFPTTTAPYDHDFQLGAQIYG